MRRGIITTFLNPTSKFKPQKINANAGKKLISGDCLTEHGKLCCHICNVQLHVGGIRSQVSIAHTCDDDRAAYKEPYDAELYADGLSES